MDFHCSSSSSSCKDKKRGMDALMLRFKFFEIKHFDFSKVVQTTFLHLTDSVWKKKICSNLKCTLSVRQEKNSFCLSPSKILRLWTTELKRQHPNRTTVKRVVGEDFQKSLTLAFPFPNTPLESWPPARAQLGEEVFLATQAIYKAACQNHPSCTQVFIPWC